MLLGALFSPVYRDWAYICENTGSRKGHREWFLGYTTGHWYQKSALEEFVQREFPGELHQRWTSYAGTGKNALGRPVLFGHGRPGAILCLRTEFFDRYVAQLSRTEKKALYDLLSSDQQERIREEVEKAFDVLLAEGRPDHQKP